MIALLIAHVVAYSDFYSLVFSAGCAGTAWHIVRRRPGQREDGDPVPSEDHEDQS